jgi:TolB-like protein
MNTMRAFAVAVVLSGAARRSGTARVAVMPLEARDAAGGRDGEALADLLTGEIVRDGRVKVVERSRLTDLMSERRLAAAGATDSSVTEPPLAAADAVIAGSFARSGSRVRASVRLVHARSGEILAAVEETFEWEGSSRDEGARAVIVVPAPEFTVEAPRIDEAPLDLHDAPNDDDCHDAAGRVDRISEGILEIKARYWASELHKGFSPYAVTRNPGSEITDPELKARFYAEMKRWFGKPFVPELSPAEFERMRREDARAVELAGRCGI